MKRYRSLLPGTVAALGMMALILDSKTALTGATEGIELCIKSVIPALFPFFVLSGYLTGALVGGELPFLRPIGKLCGIPMGGESILLTGLLGGYPVGAQCVSQAFTAGQISKADARRMLGFCSNAGPAFLFGMTGILFDRKSIPFILWLIHILSAIITGAILPEKSTARVLPQPKKQLNAGQALQQSLKVTGTVCGWVVIFRIILTFAERWLLWILPTELRIFLTGTLELTNGYIDLSALGNHSLRFIFASIFLSFGGICVMLQTASVTGQAGLDLGSYLPGKLIQTAISTALSILLSGYLFPGTRNQILLIPFAVIVPVLIGIISAKNKKNTSSIPEPSVV